MPGPFCILLDEPVDCRAIGTAFDAGASVQNPEFVNAAIADPLATAPIQYGNGMVRAFWEQFRADRTAVGIIVRRGNSLQGDELPLAFRHLFVWYLCAKIIGTPNSLLARDLGGMGLTRTYRNSPPKEESEIAR